MIYHSRLLYNVKMCKETITEHPGNEVAIIKNQYGSKKNKLWQTNLIYFFHRVTKLENQGKVVSFTIC